MFLVEMVNMKSLHNSRFGLDDNVDIQFSRSDSVDEIQLWKWPAIGNQWKIEKKEGKIETKLAAAHTLTQLCGCIDLDCLQSNQMFAYMRIMNSYPNAK